MKHNPKITGFREAVACHDSTDIAIIQIFNLNPKPNPQPFLRKKVGPMLKLCDILFNFAVCWWFEVRYVARSAVKAG